MEELLLIASADSLPQPEIPDSEIVERVRAGDVNAFATLVRRHSQRLFRVAVCVLRNEADAEEVVQDSFVRAYTHIGQFEGRAQFSTWIARIAFHAALARKQERSRFVDLDDDLPLAPCATLPGPLPPDAYAVQRQVSDSVLASLQSLPPMYRECLRLVYLEHLSRCAAASVLNISRENLKVRLHRARRLLQSQLALQGCGVPKPQ